MQDVLSSVLSGGHGRALEDEQAVTYDNAKATGDDVRRQIFGNKDVSREVAERVSTTSGVGSDILKKLLPVIATVVMGQLAKQLGSPSAQAGGSGGLGDILNDVLGGAAQPQSGPQSMTTRQGSGNALQDVLTQILGGGGNQWQTASAQIGDVLGDIVGLARPAAVSALLGNYYLRKSIARGRNALDTALAVARAKVLRRTIF